MAKPAAIPASEVFFSERFKGYDKKQVDRYIDNISNTYQAAYEEYNDLYSRYDELLVNYKTLYERQSAYQAAYDGYNDLYSRYNELLADYKTLDEKQKQNKSHSSMIIQMLADVEKLAQKSGTDT
jgi:DivIVA domain-containing protein